MSGPPIVTVRCPCGEEIDIPVKVTLTDQTEAQQFISLEPDLTDVWAHAWTHEERPT